MACGSITTGSVIDSCDDIPAGGTRARLILMNLDEIEDFDTDADGNISSITMASGKYAYEFLGFRNDVKKSEEVLKPEIGIPKFKHNAGFVIYENTQLQKNNIEKLTRGRVVAIIENKGKGENAFEVAGITVGLGIVAGAIRNAHENGGYFVLSLSTPDDEGELEPKLMQTLLVSGSGDSAYTANLAYVDALLAP